LKRLGVVSGFIKKSKGFPAILPFSGISLNCFCIGKVMDQVYGSQDHDWLSVHGRLVTMGRRGRSRAWDVIGVLAMAPLRGGAMEMATGLCSIEVTSGASMGRWFEARGGEIGARVDAVNIGGALVAHLIGPEGGRRRVVKRWETATVELQ
jgi:hypothetical protein